MRILSFVVAASSVAYSLALAAIKPGDKVPPVDLHFGFPPQMINAAARTAGKKSLMIGLPGAFTPT